MSGDANARVENENDRLVCGRCNLPLVSSRVNLTYLGNRFPVDLPKCPSCGLVYMPEELATGKVHAVEQALEDK